MGGGNAVVFRAPPALCSFPGIVLFSLASGFFPLDEAKQSDWRYAKLFAVRPHCRPTHTHIISHALTHMQAHMQAHTRAHTHTHTHTRTRTRTHAHAHAHASPQDQARGIGACDSIYSMYKRKCPFTPPLLEMLDNMLTINPAKR